MCEFQIKRAAEDKRLHAALCWISQKQRKDSLTVQIKYEKIKATALLHRVYMLILIEKTQD